MKNTKIFIHILLISIVIFCILVLPIVVLNISVAKFFLTKISVVVSLIVISLIFSFSLIKSRIAGIIVILSFVLFLSWISIIIENIEYDYEEKIVWNFGEDSFTTDFIVGRQGQLYLKAQINDVNGLLLFDTGCGLTSINEKYIPKGSKILKRITSTDSNGIKQTKYSNSVKKFALDKIEIKNLKVYPLDSLTWISAKGIYFEQDSVFGIIGNNIISKFIWDFDMLNHRVTISNRKDYCSTIPDSLAIDLVSKNDCKEIPVQINQTDKKLLLDFGCSSPIILSDSIPYQNQLKKNRITLSQKRGKGVFSHLDSTSNEQTNSGSYVDITLGDYNFKEIMCVKNNHTDLLGIPFIWSFERVVLDFYKNKSYFISDNYEASKFGVKNFNLRTAMNQGQSEILIFNAKPEGTLVKIEKDSMEVRYIVFGNFKMYRSKSGMDSLYCQDSLHLPNGETINGPITIKGN